MRTIFVGAIFALCLSSGFSLTLRGRNLVSVDSGYMKEESHTFDAATAPNGVYFQQQNQQINSHELHSEISVTDQLDLEVRASNLEIPAYADVLCVEAGSNTDTECTISDFENVKQDLRCRNEDIASSGLKICRAYADIDNSADLGACSTALCIPSLEQTDSHVLSWDHLQDTEGSSSDDSCNADSDDEGCDQCVALDVNTANTHFTSLAILKCAITDMSAVGADGAKRQALDDHAEFDHSDLNTTARGSCDDYDDLGENEKAAIAAFHNSVQEHLLAPMFLHAMEQCRNIEAKRATDRQKYRDQVAGARRAQEHVGGLLKQYQNYNDKVLSEYTELKNTIDSQSDSNRRVVAEVETEMEQLLDSWKTSQHAALQTWVENIIKKGTGFDEAIASASEDAKARVVKVNQLAAMHKEKSEQIKNVNAELQSLDETLAGILETLQDNIATGMSSLDNHRDNVEDFTADVRDDSYDAVNPDLNYEYDNSAKNGDVNGIQNEVAGDSFHTMFQSSPDGSKNTAESCTGFNMAVNGMLEDCDDNLATGLGEVQDNVGTNSGSDYELSGLVEPSDGGSGGVCGLCAA